MTELDGELPELVLELIEEFGADVVYTPVSGSSYNPATSSNTGSIGTPKPVKALVEDFKLGSYFENSLVKAGDKKFYLAAAAFAIKPSPGDLVNFNGLQYGVINLTTVYSGQLAALYTFQART